jgi:predicted metal-dependent phosphoesterase TrpH
LLKADLHLHSSYSADCASSPERILARCLQVGINCLAVADHGTIAGSVRMKEIAPFTVIISEEISTTSGDMIGYFLTKDIPNSISPEEAALRIKEQGGMVCIPHPFTHFRPSAMNPDKIDILLPYIDVIEIYNSRSTFFANSQQARIFAQKHHLLASAGSDAHTLSEIGNTYVEMPEFHDQESFRQALLQGNIVGHSANPLVHFNSTGARIKKKLISGR